MNRDALAAIEWRVVIGAIGGVLVNPETLARDLHGSLDPHRRFSRLWMKKSWVFFSLSWSDRSRVVGNKGFFTFLILGIFFLNCEIEVEMRIFFGVLVICYSICRIWVILGGCCSWIEVKWRAFLLVYFPFIKIL